jgi:hypothetical protein
MKTILTLAMLAAFSVPALAQDNNTDCNQLQDNVWSCPIPAKPAAPPTCHVFGDNLICSAPVVVAPLPAPKAPTNCGWRKGKYICW